MPALKKAIAQGEISVSQAKRISSVVSNENDTAWIDKARTLTQRELEKEVAKERPEQVVAEKLKYVQSNRLQFQCGISEDLMNKLLRAQNVLSQKRKAAVSLEQTLEAMTTLYLEREDPIQKAQRNISKEYGQQVLRQEKSKHERSAIPAKIKHQIIARDRGRCTYVDHNGKRCQQERWIALHHVQPLSLGGQHEENNLISLCSFHHRLIHTQLNA